MRPRPRQLRDRPTRPQPVGRGSAGRRGLAGLRRGLARLAHAAADLALGGVCAGCAQQPGLLCPACRAALQGPASRLRAVPGRPDLPLAGAAPYSDVVRAAILAHKERGRLPLAGPLGDALAIAVTALLAADEHGLGPPPGAAFRPAAPTIAAARAAPTIAASHAASTTVARAASPVASRAASTTVARAAPAAADRIARTIAAAHAAATVASRAAPSTVARAANAAPPAVADPRPVPAGCAAHGDRPVALIPVPSTRKAVRHRGHDPVLRAARRAATTLHRSGQRAVVVAGLRHGRRVADQAGLDRREREDNLHGSLVATGDPAGRTAGCCVVVVDDIVTTGATLRESIRALEAAGVRPCGAAVIAVV